MKKLPPIITVIDKRKCPLALTEIKTNTEHYFIDENGKLHGEYKRWYSDGTPEVHCYYLNGEYHGEYKMWYSDGTLSIHCYYLNGELHGEYKAWYPDGAPYSYRYYLNGELHGEYKMWYSDGTLSAHKLLVNGTKICELDSPSEEDKILLALEYRVTNWL